MDALGICEADFANWYLSQIIEVAKPGARADEKATNAMLAGIAAMRPRDEAEAMLIAQMIATHELAMTFARRLKRIENIAQQDSAVNGLTKLTRTYAAQMEALKRYRSGGEQKMTVQHVHVAEGGQAIVGNVSAPAEGVGHGKNQRDNPMHSLPMHRALRCHAKSKRSGSPCQAPAICRMHGAGGGAPKGNRNALKHGGFTAEGLALKRQISALARMARETIRALE
jgi:hypothetical protein